MYKTMHGTTATTLYGQALAVTVLCRQAQTEAVTVPFPEQAEQRPQHFHVCTGREVRQPK